MRATIETAAQAFGAGRLDEAEADCRQILLVEPENGDALHLLGLVALHRGRTGEAVDTLRRAVGRLGRDARLRANLGTALLEHGDTEGAIGAFRRALDLDIRLPDALYGLGSALARAGQAVKAVPWFERLVALQPDHAPALNGLGLVRAASGDPTGAIEAFRRARAAAPRFAPASYNLALALRCEGRLDEAIAVLVPLVEALPDEPRARALLAATLGDVERLDEAERHLEAALRNAPALPEALVAAAEIARRRGAFDRAATYCESALATAPDHIPALVNLGNARVALGRPAAALAPLRRVAALEPRSADHHANLARALRAATENDAAIAAADAALALDPGHTDARFCRALALLLAGRYGEGFRDYRARGAIGAAAARFHRDVLPDRLDGRRLRIERDQGLGDEIFFLRFVPALRARGAHVTYRGDPRLVPMLARSGIADAVVAADAPDTSAPDAGAELLLAVGDLPFLLGMTDADAPPPSIALAPLAAAVEAMRERLAAAGPPPYVGLTWRAGTPDREATLYKEVPRDALARALSATTATLIALQRLPAPGDIDALAAAVGRPVHDFSAVNDDLEAMLALVGLLDRYVAVSNTNVHLRAARGRSSYVLLPSPPEFRWMARGEESPWFPGTRLFRQTADGDWSTAMAALAGAPMAD
ncbi:MAG: tetratricopeptide repeat protein [Alphaproteobacteria bacterium]|nr:tetratricopeptide repeat protein [Alphaproteobacteria bacterium]